MYLHVSEKFLQVEGHEDQQGPPELAEKIKSGMEEIVPKKQDRRIPASQYTALCEVNVSNFKTKFQIQIYRYFNEDFDDDSASAVLAACSSGAVACTGLPPESCSAFGSDGDGGAGWRTSISDPEVHRDSPSTSHSSSRASLAIYGRCACTARSFGSRWCCSSRSSSPRSAPSPSTSGSSTATRTR